jgi:hypothetical protein
VWTSCYNGTGNGDDGARAIAVSPDGVKLFVTGRSAGNTSGLDYATEGIDALTGSRLWVRRYAGSANGDDQACCVKVSPDGSTVYVTGTSAGSATGGASTGTTAEGKSGARGAAAPTDNTSASTDDKARTHTGKAKNKNAKAKAKKNKQEESSTKSDKDTTSAGATASGRTSTGAAAGGTAANSMPKKPDSSAAPMKSDSTVRSGKNSPEKSEKSD